MSTRITWLVCGSVSLALLVAWPALAQTPEHAALVQRALAAEADGRAGERIELGNQAAQVAGEDDAELQWLAGRVRYAGAWRTPEDIAQLARRNSGQQAFQRFRAVPRSWASMAGFCANQKLEDEASIYWQVAVQASGNEEGRRALGLVKHRGVFCTPAQAKVMEAEEADTQEHRKRWQQTVARWNETNSLEDCRKEAAQQFRDLPPEEILSATEAILQVRPGPNRMAKSNKPDLETLREVSLELVHSLATRREQAPTIALVHLTIRTRWPEVRDAAALALRGRPFNAFVPQMLSIMESEIESKFSIYASPEGQFKTFHTLTREGAEQNDLVTRQTNIEPTSDGSVVAGAAGARLVRQAAGGAARLDGQVKQANASISARNAWIREALVRSTGEKYVDEPRFWWKWWRETNELIDEVPTNRQTYESNLTYTYYYPRYRPPYATFGNITWSSFSFFRSSCFAPGTLVWTLTGAEPIENIRVGDLVLSQHAETGEWAYKPVLRTTYRESSPMQRISLEGESFVATKGHAFWTSGKGWEMTKQLTAGSRLHGFEGSSEVREVAAAPESPTHNLVVADFHTYCVGRSKTLTHDITMPEPVFWPLPGLRQADFERMAPAKP